MSGYTVPIAIIGTDAAQSALFTGGADYLGGSPPGPSFAGSITASSWFSYPDAREGYRFPEHKSPVEEALDDFRSTTPGKCMLGTKGGYTAQPLHGVWATGPYLHNGSVPTVWDLLAPAGRPDVWLRQQVPASEASPGLGDRGFDTDMARAYDYEKLGWKYERVSCDARKDVATQLSCASKELVPSPLDALLTPLKAVADYVSPPYLAGPGEGEVDARAVYNTHAYSKGNHGHEFPKVLTNAERRALVEYLKTL